MKGIKSILTVEQDGAYFTGRLDAIDSNGRFTIQEVQAVFRDGSTHNYGSTGFIFDSKEVKITAAYN